MIAVLLILAPYFNKMYKAGWQYWLWLAVTVRLLLPFPSGEAAPVILKLPVSEGLLTGVNGAAHGALFPGGSFSEAAGVRATGTGLSLLELLALVYFIGVFAFLIYRFACYIAFRRSIRKWCSKPAAKITETAADVGRLYGIDMKKHRVSILICRKIPGPMAVGFIRPVLLLPVADYEDRKLRMILSHELIHIKRRDMLYKFLLILACSLHWFNPAVHFMAGKANQSLEVCCDARVLQKADIDEKKMYSHMILELASRGSNRLPVLFNSFGSGKESLEMRIGSIFSPVLKKSGAVSLITIILITLSCGSAVQISVSAEVYGQAGKPGSYQNTAPAADMEAGGTNENAGGKSGTSNGDPEKPESPQALTEEQSQTGDPSRQAGQGSSENEENQASEPAEIVIVDLNQLTNGQAQAPVLPQE
jgi:beta-lactamase regulating signal transducer with metallopeptidase domain